MSAAHEETFEIDRCAAKVVTFHSCSQIRSNEEEGKKLSFLTLLV
jgi:hypothetical protein